MSTTDTGKATVIQRTDWREVAIETRRAPLDSDSGSNQRTPVEFIVTFYKQDGGGDDNPFAFLSVPPHLNMNILSSKLFSQTSGDEHGCREEAWIYVVALKDVDAFEEAVVRCNHVISYERSLIPGDCARTKTFFRRGP
jgi:hypothetical protein